MLLAKIETLQKQINTLNQEKNTLAPATYSARLEELLIQLAQSNRDLKAMQEAP